MTPFSSRGEVKNYCHSVHSETYEVCPEKDFYTIGLNTVFSEIIYALTLAAHSQTE